MMSSFKIHFKGKDANYDTLGIELLGMAFLFYAGSYAIKAIFSGIGLVSLESIGSLFFYLLWARKLARVIRKDFNVIIKILIWEIIFIAILYINLIYFAESRTYYEEYKMFFRQILIVFLPCGVVISQVETFDRAFLFLKKYAYAGSIIMLISLPLGYMDIWDYQYWGVHLSPFLIIIFECYQERHKRSDFILLLIDIILIFFGGRQSLIISVIVCVALYIYYNRKKSLKMLIIVFIMSFIGILVISGLYSSVLQEFGNLLNVFGIQGRTIDSLVEGNLFDTSTRNIIYEYSLLSIEKIGTKITGIFADRMYLRNLASWMAYPHNIYLELLMDFGVVLGTLLSFVLTIKVLQNMFLGDNEARKKISIFLGVLVMVRLLVSSSFVIEGYFYILLGLIFSKNEKSEKMYLNQSYMTKGEDIYESNKVSL